MDGRRPWLAGGSVGQSRQARPERGVGETQANSTRECTEWVALEAIGQRSWLPQARRACYSAISFRVCARACVRSCVLVDCRCGLMRPNAVAHFSACSSSPLTLCLLLGFFCRMQISRVCSSLARLCLFRSCFRLWSKPRRSGSRLSAASRRSSTMMTLVCASQATARCCAVPFFI